MAEFNPFLPQPNIPDWTNAPGRLIDGSGLGELFGKLASGTAEYYGKEKERQATNDLYQSADKAADDGRLGTLAEAAGIPVDVARAMDKAKLYRKAFESGKFSEANFYNKMDVWSKEMRVRYPQYRDVIDQQLTRVMGRTPANLEMDSVRQQYEADQQNKSTAAGKDETFRSQNAEYLTPEEHVQWDQAGAGSPIREMLKTKALILKSDRANLEWAWKMAEQGGKADVTTMAPVVSQLVSNIERQVYLGAISKGGGTLLQLRQTIEKMREGGFSFEETAKINAMVQAAKDSIDQAWTAGTTTPGESGKSLADYFASDPTAWNAQKSRIEKMKSDLDGLMSGKAGVFEWNATEQAALTYTNMQKLKDRFGADFVDGLKGIESLVGQDNMALIYQNISQTEGKDPITDYMTGLITGKALKDQNIGSAIEDFSKAVDGSYKSQANLGTRGAVEALIKTAVDTKISLEGRSAALTTILGDKDNKFIRLLRDDPDNTGLSSREKFFKRMTSPEIIQAAKQLGKEKEYTAWVKNTSVALYSGAIEEVNVTNKSSKYIDIVFNPNSMQFEAKLNKSLVKNPQQVTEYLRQRRSNGKGFNSAIPTDIPLEDLDAIKNGMDALQKLNMINGALVEALKAEKPGIKGEDLVKEVLQYMGDLKSSYDKKDPWQTRAFDAVKGYLKDTLSGENIKKSMDQNRKDISGEDFGVVPGGDVNFSVLEGGSATSRVGTTPDTGDDTANQILAFIHGAEGADYNTVFGGGKVDAASMTVQDVLDRTENDGSSAFGAVQVMKKTLAGLVKNGVVTPDQKMDQATQDKIGLALMKKAGYDNWKSGKLSPKQFADKLADIWASLPLQDGKSKYASDGVNKATVSRQQFLAMLAELA